MTIKMALLQGHAAVPRCQTLSMFYPSLLTSRALTPDGVRAACIVQSTVFHDGIIRVLASKRVVSCLFLHTWSDQR